MAYPRELLIDGETVARELKPHWRALFVPLIILALVVGLGIWLLILSFGMEGSGGTILRWVLLAAAIVILVWFVLFPFMRWLTTEYVFTNKRIILREGLLTKRGRDIPLSKVNGISHMSPFLGRLLNYGALTIDSANESGEVYIADVPNVEEIQRLVYSLMEGQTPSAD